jgi:hypothetical protein
MAETSRKDVRKKDLGAISLVIDSVKEQEADRQAVGILREAGYDPHAMLDVARRLPSRGHPSDRRVAGVPGGETGFGSRAPRAVKRYGILRIPS